MQTVRTSLLEIAYEVGGPPDGPPVLLLHGWPDDALGWRPVSERLNASGFRTIAPYLRGFAPTRFLGDFTVTFADTSAALLSLVFAPLRGFGRIDDSRSR